MNLSREAIINLRPPSGDSPPSDWQPPTLSFLSQTWYITHSTTPRRLSRPNGCAELDFSPGSTNLVSGNADTGTVSANSPAQNEADGHHFSDAASKKVNEKPHHGSRLLDFLSRKLHLSKNPPPPLGTSDPPSSTTPHASIVPTPSNKTPAIPLDPTTQANPNTASEFLIPQTGPNSPTMKLKILAWGKEGQIPPGLFDDGDGWISDASGERRGDWRDSFCVVLVDFGVQGDFEGVWSVGEGSEGLGIEVWDHWGGSRPRLTAETVGRIRDALVGVGVVAELKEVVPVGAGADDQVVTGL